MPWNKGDSTGHRVMTPIYLYEYPDHFCREGRDLLFRSRYSQIPAPLQPLARKDVDILGPWPSPSSISDYNYVVLR